MLSEYDQLLIIIGGVVFGVIPGLLAVIMMLKPDKPKDRVC